MNYINKVAAINDLSCFGRASITTIISILSSMGIQVCPLPTAVLSTHMGGFGTPAKQDLSTFLHEAKRHWSMIDIDFQCIYSGYLANTSQIDFVKEFIRDFKKNETLIVIDPVMGDNGILYSSMDNNMVNGMKELIKVAHVITPNITEAAFLLDEEHKEYYEYGEIENWVKRLSNLGPDNVVITSVPSEKGVKYLDTISYSKSNNRVFKYTNKKIDTYYPGTGDAFTSVLIGSILNRKSFSDSIVTSCKFISQCIDYSNQFDYPNNYGILLEKMLNKLK